ncbi:MAG: tRNA (guanosine(46)-N7)-methyltransferase TrmB [Candidatus Omnitrophota bacterium]|jgi:tRNA (guanine-N7-)-methyltransferase
MLAKLSKPPYVAPKPEDFPKISFPEYFGNDRPVEVEIGCGKGKFLLDRSALHPERNFLGLDYAGKWMKKGLVRGEKRKLVNLKFLKGEARLLLSRFEPAGVSVFHLYFPDPWPKRRHHKRRLVTPEFLGCLRGFLTEQGLIEMATDNRDYFLVMKEAVEGSGVAWRSVRESVNERLAYGECRTSYEIKYAAERRPLYYLELQK